MLFAINFKWCARHGNDTSSDGSKISCLNLVGDYSSASLDSVVIGKELNARERGQQLMSSNDSLVTNSIWLVKG